MRLTVKILGILIAALVVSSCASQPKGPKPLPPSIYEGRGKDMNVVGAIRLAKKDAIRKAVLDLVGEKQEQLWTEKIANVVYNTSDPDKFVFADTIENVNRSKEGEATVVVLRMKVDMQAINQALQGIGVAPGAGAKIASDGSGNTTGGSTGLTPGQQRARDLVMGVDRPQDSGGTPANSGTGTTPPATGGTTLTAATEEDWGKPTAEEASFLRRYVDTMTYMVYFGEASKEDPAVLRAAVNIANRYFTQNTMEVVDMSTIESLKKEQQKVWEESTGGEQSFLQWIAQRLNADVYMELDTVSDTSNAPGGHYGSVNLTMKLFDPSTGRLLGSQNLNSDRSFSRVSKLDAVTNAIQSSVFKITPLAVNTAKAYMEKALNRGIRYELIIQQTVDPRLMSQFRRQLQSLTKSVEVTTQEASESRYTVFFVGSSSDLENSIYRAADRVPGLEGMYNVLIRGKSLTFHTGL